MMNTKEKIVKTIYRESTVNRITKKIKLLGVTCKYNAIKMLNTRLFLSIIIFSIIIASLKYGYILAPIITITYWFLVEYITLDVQIKKRINRLDSQAIFFFEVLSLSLESGKDIKSSLDITIKSVDNELSLEFKKCLEEMAVGKSFYEAIKSMKERIPSDAINNVLINISQSSYYGNDIMEALNNQINYLRNKRVLEVRSNINKLPTKISVASVIFFIPIILLIILAPIIVNLFK